MTTAQDGGFPMKEERGPAPAPPTLVPQGLTVAISRQAGARGNSIARRLSRQLGWAIYDREMLTFMAQEDIASQLALPTDTDSTRAWANAYLAHLQATQQIRGDELFLALVRVLLRLAAVGEVIIVGRGAGHILPPESVLHVRVVAPTADRIGYLSQWLRLPPEAAAHEVRRRDQRRADFLAAHYPHASTELDQYDLGLNSSRLGEEQCVDLIVTAIKQKMNRRPQSHSELSV